MKCLWDYTFMFQLWYRDLRIGWQMNALCCPVKGQCQVKCISFMPSVSLQQLEKIGITFSPVKEIEVLQKYCWPCNFLRRLYHSRNTFFCYLNMLSYLYSLSFYRVRFGITVWRKQKNHLILSIFLQSHFAKDFCKIFQRLKLQFSCSVYPSLQLLYSSLYICKDEDVTTLMSSLGL